MADEVELRAATGFVEPAIREEFPGLRLDWLTVACSRPHDSPREVKRRLRSLSNRYRGASVVAMRTQPIPHAYRTFFRQIGVDPDTTRIPSEAAAVARLLRGGFEPSTLVDDARLIALVETGVPLWALDAAFVDPGGLGIRTSVAGDRLGPDLPLGPGRLTVADGGVIARVAVRRRSRACGRPADRACGPLCAGRRRRAGDRRRGGAAGVSRGGPFPEFRGGFDLHSAGRLPVAIKGGSHGAPRGGKYHAPQVAIPAFRVRTCAFRGCQARRTPFDAERSRDSSES